MKLHLPIALLTAVLCSMSYAVAEVGTVAGIDRTLTGEAVEGATHGDLTVTIGDGNYTGTNMYYNSKPGFIAGAAHIESNGKESTLAPVPTEPNGSTSNPMDIYSSLNMVVGSKDSEGPTIKYLAVEGRPVNSVVGDKSVTVNSGNIQYLYGGIVYDQGATSANLNHVGNYVEKSDGDRRYYAYKDSSNPADLNITINGGTVGQIRAGHSGKQGDYIYDVLQDAQDHDTNKYDELMADKPWSISGDVNIAVNGGVIDADYAGKTTAIMGAGGSGHSVDGTVKVSVSGGTVLGDIFAGGNNIYSEVGATRVEISGGAITGNVYGGGDIDDGRTKYASYTDAPAPTVKGGTTVVLSGGTIDGNVYAAGVQDIVNAGADNVGTHVVISGDGTEVTGTISGQGLNNNSTVVGDRLLTIENNGGKNVNWDKIEGFNAVEFNGSQSYFGTLSKDFEKVSAENSHLVGKFEDGEVQLNANDSWLEIAGDLTTTKGSSITNTDKPMTVTGDATFKGTIMENADLEVKGDIAFNNGSLSAEDTPLSSSVTNSNLVAGGNMSFQQTTMNSGTLSVGGELSLNGATVVVDSINNGNSVLLKGDSNVIVLDGDMDLTNPEDWGALQDWINGNGTSTGSAHAEPTSLTVNSDLKLATGSSFKGSGDSAAKLTANSITTDGAVTFEKSDVKATQGDIALSAGSKVTDSTLTAAENVTIGDSSTVSGSKVTSTNGNIDVAGSTLSNINLFANNGTITITNSEVTNSGAARYIYGETVKIENSTFESQTSNKTLFIDGNIEVSDGHFVTTGGLINFGGQSLVLDSKSTIDAQTGTIYFSSDTVVSNGATIEANGGDIHVYNEFIANAGTTITSNKGLIDFQGDVNATGATITAAGANINFVKDLVIEGSTITSKKTINLLGDVTATNTIFDADGGSFMFKGSNGKVQLNGGNELKGGLFSFQNSTEIIANGDNSISGQVGMSHDSKLTAESGTLAITTQSYSTLQNLQQTGDAQINVTANGGTLNLKGKSTIESLTLNNTTTNNTGYMTTDKLVATGGKIVNEYSSNNFSLVVKEDTQLSGTSLTNNKGVVRLQGTVNVAGSTLVNNDGSIQITGTVVSENNTYQANGGEIWFSNRSDKTLVDTNSTFIANEGATIQFGQNNPPGRVEFNGSDIVTNGGQVQFNCAVDANAGTTITANDGEIHFNKLLDINGGTITKGTDGTITFHRDVVAENTQIIVNGGSMHFDGNLVKNIALNGGNEIKANGSGTLMFSQGSTATITAKGNNTIDAGFIMGTGNQLVAEGGVLNITNGAEDSNNSLTLVNVKIADDAAEGTKINVTANKGQGKLEIGGSSSISNLTVNGANSTIKGDLDIAEKLVVNNATSGSMTVTETGALTAENAEINGSSLVNEGTANLKNVALTDGSSVSNTGETLELGAATVSGSVSIKHNTDGTTKIGGITKTDDSAYVSLSQAGGTVEFNGGKGTVAEIDSYNSGVSDAAMVQSGDGTVNVGRVLSTYGTVEFKQTGNGEMNFGAGWINWDTNSEINQTGKGHINFRAGAANVGSVTQSGGGTFTYDAPGSRILSLDISNGSTFEAMCSVELDDVAISDATLFNAGTMTMDSLVMDNATLLFAASALDSCSSFIFNGDGGLTGYGISNVSAADMIKEFGVVMSGTDAADLLKQWGSEVEFSFTLAQGSELFEKEFAYVLEQNLAEFTITLGEAAELSFADGEIKDITVEDTENGVVVKGIAVIPEPTTATLSLLALAALAARRRRK